MVYPYWESSFHDSFSENKVNVVLENTSKQVLTHVFILHLDYLEHDKGIIKDKYLLTLYLNNFIDISNIYLGILYKQ